MPADKFEGKFGLPWADALATGRAVNAMDACARLGLDADGLSAAWKETQAKGNHVKLGGGFYCGLVEVGRHTF